MEPKRAGRSKRCSRAAIVIDDGEQGSGVAATALLEYVQKTEVVCRSGCLIERVKWYRLITVFKPEFYVHFTCLASELTRECGVRHFVEILPITEQ
jgi:hypothetical protein